MKSSPIKSKNSAFTKKKKKKNARPAVISSKPKHRFFPKGVSLSYRSSYNLILRAKGNGLLSEGNLNAFRKTIQSKYLRRLFVYRAYPYMELTKKPNEVRMGKGHGTKIAKRLFPFVPGQALVEVNLRRRFRRTRVAKKALRKASSKFPFRTIFKTMDI